MKVKIFLIALGVMFGLATSASAAVENRSPSSMAFPNHSAQSSTSRVNADYPDYLKFVLDVGRSTKPRTAHALELTYTKLHRLDPELAARFLRGLRFELVQRIELRGLPPNRLTNQNPQLRPWITKYLGTWLREADEYLFRAYAAKRVGRT